jgi:hypothetical protein
VPVAQAAGKQRRTCTRRWIPVLQTASKLASNTAPSPAAKDTPVVMADVNRTLSDVKKSAPAGGRGEDRTG